VAGDLSYRRGRADDLGAVNAIFHEAQTEGDATPPALLNGLPIFPHEIAHSELWVATEAGTVVGFAATVERGGTAFLAELFVRRDRRSNGIGAALLERCFDDRGLPRMTMSSPDPRALALYVSLGLEPRWPLFYLIGEPARSSGSASTTSTSGTSTASTRRCRSRRRGAPWASWWRRARSATSASPSRRPTPSAGPTPCTR
jgi:GNAT superfamily N-acetyltransferase